MYAALLFRLIAGAISHTGTLRCSSRLIAGAISDPGRLRCFSQLIAGAISDPGARPIGFAGVWQ